MLSPNKICTNCAPVFFEYYQKGLDTQSKILRMRDELQRLSFNQQLGTLKDVSEADLSVSPHEKFQFNSKIGAKKAFPLNITQKENSILDKQTSIASNTTILRNLTPIGKYSTKPFGDRTIHNRSQDVLKNVSNYLPTTMGTVSPLERLRDFEDQVNKKVDSFKKKLREEVAKSAKRNSYSKNLPSRPKTTGKFLRVLGDDENKSAPKVSRFSPGGEGKSPALSPIQFKFTPRLDRKENTEKGSGPSLGEWTVGTTKDHKNNTTQFTEKGFTPERINLDSPFKKVKDTLKKDLEAIEIKSKELPSPSPQEPIRLQSPFFSPLRASELTSPNIQHGHLKSDEHKKDYRHFIKPKATPLLDSIMSSSREAEKDSKSIIPPISGSSSEDMPMRKKGSYKSTYYKELFSNPLEDSPSSRLVKTDKVQFADGNMKEQDEMQTINEALKFNHSQSKSMSAIQRSHIKRPVTKADEDELEKLLNGGSSYDRTQKKAYDFFKPMKGNDTVGNQDCTWYIPVNVKGGKFYSTDDMATEFKIGQPSNKSHHEGGILVHSTAAEAMKSQLLSPRLNSNPKVLLEVKVEGPSKRIDESSSLYSSITPVRAVYNDFDDLSL